MMIKELYAFVCTKHDGSESIVGWLTPGDVFNTWLPMVFTTLSSAEKMRPIAEKIAEENGVKLKLLNFQFNGEIK